jgi:hypothetical protein
MNVLTIPKNRIIESTYISMHWIISVLFPDCGLRGTDVYGLCTVDEWLCEQYELRRICISGQRRTWQYHCCAPQCDHSLTQLWDNTVVVDYITICINLNFLFLTRNNILFKIVFILITSLNFLVFIQRSSAKAFGIREMLHFKRMQNPARPAMNLAVILSVYKSIIITVKENLQACQVFCRTHC